VALKLAEAEIFIVVDRLKPLQEHWLGLGAFSLPQNLAHLDFPHIEAQFFRLCL